MTPIPEPMCDLRAQVAALLDPMHPKRAVLIVPGNEVPPVPGVRHIERSTGTLLTRDPARAAAFADGHEHDATMAWILGYPEDKGEVVRACGRMPEFVARAVQARDAAGAVVTEAFTSPVGLDRTVEAIRAHVPGGGVLTILSPIEAITRRIMLRVLERANG